MKHVTTIFILLILFSFVSGVFAQIPNPGFENWNGNEPVGWVTNNIPGDAEPITPSTDSYSGSYALRGEVLSFITPIPPMVVAGESTTKGFPVSQRYASLTGYYKFAPVGNDAVLISVFLAKDGNTVGAGGIGLGKADSYTPFNVPIFYGASDVPDTATINITIADTTTAQIANVGSVMLVDNLEFSGVVSIDDYTQKTTPSTLELFQNYPNPFNPVTTIRFEISRPGKVILDIYNLLGEKVAELVNQNMAAGTYSVQWKPENTLPGGIYFYRLRFGNKVKTRKMIYLK